jgi:hypothetical protein
VLEAALYSGSGSLLATVRDASVDTPFGVPRQRHQGARPGLNEPGRYLRAKRTHAHTRAPRSETTGETANLGR